MKKIITILISLAVFSGAEAQELKDLIKDASEHYSAGNCQEALVLLADILEAKEAISQDKALWYTLNYYAGHCAYQEGNWEAARSYFTETLNSAIVSDNSKQIPSLRFFLGEIAAALGYLREAEEQYTTALAHIEDGKDKAALYYMLAELKRSTKQYQEALAFCDNATRIAKSVSAQKIEFSCITNMAEVYYEMGDYARAIHTFSNGLNLARNAQFPVEMANNYAGLAMVYEQLEKYEYALMNYTDALRLYLASLSFDNVVLITDRLATLAANNKAKVSANIGVYEKFATELYTIGESEALVSMHFLIGEAYLQADNISMAQNAHKNAINVSMLNDMPQNAMSGAIRLATIHYNSGSLEMAISTLEDAAKYQSLQTPPIYLAEIYAFQGELYIKNDTLRLAEYVYRKALEVASDPEDRITYEKILAELAPQITIPEPLSAGKPETESAAEAPMETL